jgi:hypothetical protein
VSGCAADAAAVTAENAGGFELRHATQQSYHAEIEMKPGEGIVTSS